MTQTGLDQRLADMLRGSPTLMDVLSTVQRLGLPDWRIASGAVYQTVWNALTGRDPDHGIRDYDVLYFDPDTSWEAEDLEIRRAAAAFSPSLAAMVELRNQARVHLWFEAKFREPYAALSCTDEALQRFVAPAFAVGVRLEQDGAFSIAAPFGLEDMFAMRLRPNPSRAINPAGFARTSASVRARWPELVVEGGA